MTSITALSWRWRLAVAAILAVTPILLVSPASAHSELLESRPADGAQLDRAPAQVQLVFGENVQQQGGTIVVAVRDTIVSDSSTFTTKGNLAEVQLTGPDQPGTYTVSFRVVSADGHVVSDTFAYEVVDASSASATSDSTDAPTGDQSPAAATSAPADNPEDSNASVVWVLGLGAIGIVLVITVIAVAVRGRRERSD